MLTVTPTSRFRNLATKICTPMADDLNNLSIALFPFVLPGFRHLVTRSYASMDDMNDLSIAPLPAVPSKIAEGAVSLEVMLYNGKVEYDFAVNEAVVRRLKRGRGARKLKEVTMRDLLLDYRKSFENVLADQGSSSLKLDFYVIRLRLNALLVERLLRDFVKRSKWHIGLLAKKDAADKLSAYSDKLSAYSGKPSHLLLREVANFERRREVVFTHIDEAIGYYQLKSGVEFFALEKEIFGLRNRVQFKDLTQKLENCVS